MTITPAREHGLDPVLSRMARASAARNLPPPELLCVSKTRSVAEISRLAAALHDHGLTRRFGENYVQEAADKIGQLTPREFEWHLIGHLQSNKARQAAEIFDWVQTIDRPKLISALAAHRPSERPPLNVLIQVNIDDEASKHGCQPQQIDSLADEIARFQRLKLRGLMAIPAPAPDPTQRRQAFVRMRQLFDRLRQESADIDTLSMGMSDDLELAIAEGSTMVRIGTALFGERPKP